MLDDGPTFIHNLSKLHHSSEPEKYGCLSALLGRESRNISTCTALDPIHLAYVSRKAKEAADLMNLDDINEQENQKIASINFRLSLSSPQTAYDWMSQLTSLNISGYTTSTSDRRWTDNALELEENEEINMEFFINLQFLRVSRVPSKYFKNFSSLSKTLISLSYNRSLTNIEELISLIYPNDELQIVNWKLLQKISVADNNLMAINSSLLAGMRSLKEFDASNNFLKELPDCFFNVEKLDLSFNEICSLETSRLWSHLQYLFISGNKIQSLKWLMNFQGLKYLDLSRNLISEVLQFRHFNLPHLQHLLLVGNPVCASQKYPAAFWKAIEKKNRKSLKLDGKKIPILTRLRLRSIETEELTPQFPEVNEANLTNLDDTDQRAKSQFANSNDYYVEAPKLIRHYERELLKSLEKSSTEAIKDNGPNSPSENDSLAVTGIPTSSCLNVGSNVQEAKNIKKKKTKKIVPAGEEDMDSQNSLPTNQSHTQDLRTQSFKQKIESMRLEEGTSWLKIYGGSPGNESFIPEHTSRSITVSRNNSLDISIPQRQPNSSSDFDQADSPITSSLPESPMEIVPRKVPINHLKSAEKAFYVQVLVDRIPQTPLSRILIASETVINELDSISGRKLASRLIKGIVNLKRTKTDRIILDYKVPKKDCFSICYSMENEAACEELYNILSPAVEKNRALMALDRIIPNWKCLACSSVYSNLPGKLSSCPKCTGSLIEFYPSAEMNFSLEIRSNPKKSSKIDARKIFKEEKKRGSEQELHKLLSSYKSVIKSLSVYFRLSIFQTEQEEELAWIYADSIYAGDLLEENIPETLVGTLSTSLTRAFPFTNLTSLSLAVQKRESEFKRRKLMLLLSKKTLYILAFSENQSKETPLDAILDLLQFQNSQQNLNVLSLIYLSRIHNISVSNSKQFFCIFFKSKQTSEKPLPICCITRNPTWTSKFLDSLALALEENFIGGRSFHIEILENNEEERNLFESAFANYGYGGFRIERLSGYAKFPVFQIDSGEYSAKTLLVTKGFICLLEETLPLPLKKQEKNGFNFVNIMEVDNICEIEVISQLISSKSKISKVDLAKLEYSNDQLDGFIIYLIRFKSLENLIEVYFNSTSSKDDFLDSFSRLNSQHSNLFRSD